MRWQGRRGSTNIEDRRGVRLGRAGGIGLGTIVLALLAIYFGQDPSVVLQNIPQQSGPAEQVPYQESTAEEAVAYEFMSVVLADTEQAWGEIFAAAGRTYEEPTLVLFKEAVQSGCGVAPAAVGPFYCPVDRKVYIDLTFYRGAAEPVRRAGRFRAGVRHRT